jgi:tRNA A-37 threonylcarbamoyl transferase component Bud32
MTSDAQALRAALVGAVQQAMEALTFLDAVPVTTGGSTVSAGLTHWSWIRITEPCPGMVVVALSTEVIAQICRCMLGQSVPPGSVGAGDCQAELTNILAGRLMHAITGPQAAIGIGLPRTGRGAPNVKEPGWVGQEFRLEDQRFAVFVQGDGLAAMARAKTTPTPVTTVRAGEGCPAAAETTVVGFVPVVPVAGAEPVAGPDAVPTALSGYRLLERLGDGGMGVIYKARHQTLDRLAALKVMRSELAQNERFVQRFLREARIAASIDHPNVVPVYDAGFQDGHLFIAMRYIPGGDLSQAMRERGPLPQAEALVLVANCLLGLQAISDAGLVHRDIKPANILLDADGSPRLADLGLARTVARDDHLTQAGSVQGTPAYMAPEQARGQDDLDVRADLYAFGATLYALLSGQPPFAGASVYETVAQVLTRPPPSLLARHPALHPAVDRLVQRAMAKDPADRPQSPQAFIEEIAEILPLVGAATTSASGRLRLGEAVAAGRHEARPPSGEHWLARLLRRRRE